MHTEHTVRIAALAALLAATGCGGERATEEQCRAIADRIVAIELYELGFRDPALVARKSAEMAQRFASELRTCIGKPLPAGAMECLEEARTSEELSHRCLAR